MLLVAVIHVAVVPALRRTLIKTLSPADFGFIWSPFLLNHMVVGVLLVPVAVSTMLCADGLRRGETWAWRIGLSNGLAILGLPIVLAATMQRQYFRAVPFLVAAILISIVGGSMIWPLLWSRKDNECH